MRNMQFYVYSEAFSSRRTPSTGIYAHVGEECYTLIWNYAIDQDDQRVLMPCHKGCEVMANNVLCAILMLGLK